MLAVMSSEAFISLKMILQLTGLIVLTLLQTRCTTGTQIYILMS